MKPNPHKIHLLVFAITILMGFSHTAWAQNTNNVASNSLKNLNLHCGFTPKLDTIQDLEDNARDYNEAPPQDIRYEPETLLLVVHFEDKSAQLPKNCLKKIEGLAQATKQASGRQLVLRSSTQTGSSPELDLAMAQQRLSSIYSKFRQLRVPRKIILLELHAQPVNPLLDEGLATPRLVEIYSKSTN